LANALSLSWSGGTPPYLLQRKTVLSETNWFNVLTTSDTKAIVAKEGNTGFFRVADHAQTTVTSFTVWMSGSGEVPAVATPATGIATLSLEGSNLSFQISYQGLSGVPTLMHFHGPATSTNTASPVVDLTSLLAGAGPSGTIRGSKTLSADQIAALNAGVA